MGWTGSLRATVEAMTTPLIVTQDHQLLDALMPLAAAAGVEPLVTAELPRALSAWSAASLVLVGPDLAPSLAQCRLPRREEVYLVTCGTPETDLFRVAIELQTSGLIEASRSESWLVERLGAQADGPPGVLVGVVGGSGGAGATTLVCALGQTAARRGPTLLIDADPTGPGLDRVLGMEQVAGVRWTELERTTGRLGGAALREAVPRSGALGVLTWYPGPQGSLQAFAVREVLAAGVRGHGLVVVDLPRAGGDLAQEIAARCDRVLVVTQPTVTGVSSAARIVGRFGGDRAALVLHGSGAVPADMAKAVGAPVLCQMPSHRGLAESVDLGLGPLRSPRGQLHRACVSLLGALDVSARAA